MKRFVISLGFLCSSIFGMQPETTVAKKNEVPDIQMSLKAQTNAFAEKFVQHEQINAEELKKNNEKYLSILENKLAAAKKEFEQKLAETTTKNEAKQKELQDQVTQAKWIGRTGFAIAICATAGLGALYTKYAHLSASIAQVNTKIDATDNTVNSIADRINQQDNKVYAVDNKVNSLATHANEQDAQIYALHNATADISAQIKIINSSLNQANKNIKQNSKDITCITSSKHKNENNNNSNNEDNSDKPRHPRRERDRNRN